MEQLSELPPPAIIVFGITLAVIFAVQRLGFLSGAKAPSEKSTAATQVAAVIVDPTELRKATVAVDSLTLSVTRLVRAIEHSAKGTEEAAGAVEDLAQEAGKVREELYLSRELARR